MKKNLSVLITLFVCFIHLAQPTKALTLDPIKFSMTTTGKKIGIGEEFEITIQAQYVNIPTNGVSAFSDRNSFRLKLIIPNEFRQSGGTYKDYIGTTLSKGNPSATYTMKGKLVAGNSSSKFVLLRGTGDTHDKNPFYSVSAITFSMEEAGVLPEKDRRITSFAVNAVPYVPYMNISDLRLGRADTAQVVQIVDGLKSGTFVYDPANTAADDTVMVLRSGARRYLRQYDGVVNTKWITSSLEASFVRLLNTIGSKPVTIILDKTIRITSYRLIPSNIKIDFQQGAMFDVKPGVTLDLISEITEGNQQLFSGLGTVHVRTDKVNLTWFGAKDELLDNTFAFEAAHRCLSVPGNYQGGTLFIPPGIYRTKKITAIARINYVGAGSGVSIIKLKDSVNSDLLYIPLNAFLINIRDLSFDGNSFRNPTGGSCIAVQQSQDTTTHYIDVFRNKQYQGNNMYKFLNISNVACVYAKQNGIYLPKTNFITTIDNVYLQANNVGLWNESTDNMFNKIVAEKNFRCGIRESGANNKWNMIKVIFNGLNKVTNPAETYYGGLVMYNCKRSIITNGESQDNFGPGVIIENGESIVLSGYVSDCNGYKDNNQNSSDTTSEGFRFVNMIDSKIISCKATNYRFQLKRPWIQTFGYSQDVRCSNNQIDVTGVDQEKAPKTISQSLSKNVNVISRRNSAYTQGGITYDIDQPVIDSGILVTAGDRIELPTVIPYRNVLSYLFQFQYMGKTGSTTQLKVINTSDGLLKLDYVMGTTNYLIATITTPKGSFSAQIDDTLQQNREYRVYFELKGVVSGFARTELKLSYLNSSSGVVFKKANRNYPVSGNVIGAFENIFFNDYDPSPAANILLRLIYFMMADKAMPDDFAKIGYPIDDTGFILSVDFGNVRERSLNTIKSGSLPMAGKYYLNKTFNTNAGSFTCVEDGAGGYKFVSTSDNTVKSVTATGNGTTNHILIPHGLSYTPTITGILAKDANSTGISYCIADVTNFKIYYASPPTGNLSYTISFIK